MENHYENIGALHIAVYIRPHLYAYMAHSHHIHVQTALIQAHQIRMGQPQSIIRLNADTATAAQLLYKLVP